MLVFVIPLKSQQTSKSWPLVSRLFERCLKSVCNQTISDFKVVVACHEKPEINFSHPNIDYLSVDFAPPKIPKYVNKNTDKGRKIMSGLVYAGQFNPSHTMVVDADDCVSRQLAAFVEKNTESQGWFINRGYKYRENDECIIYLKINNFYRMCGTCNILRYDLNFLPSIPEYNRGYSYYKYYIDHARVRDVLRKKNIFLKALPFPGAVYVLGHGDNNTENDKKLLFSWFNRRVLTKAICEEFSLYNLDKISPVH